MKKYLKPILNKLMITLKYSFSSVFFIVGILGLTVSYINPMKFIVPILPFQIEGTIISIDQALVQSWLIYLNTNLTATVVISSILLLMGVLVHVRNFKIWWFNLRKAPMGIVRLPIRKLTNQSENILRC